MSPIPIHTYHTRSMLPRRNNDTQTDPNSRPTHHNANHDRRNTRSYIQLWMSMWYKLVVPWMLHRCNMRILQHKQDHCSLLQSGMMSWKL